MSEEVRQRSPSPTAGKVARTKSPELEEKRKAAAEAMKKRSQKQSDFFDKYAYHLVIGGFVLLCVLAFGSTLFRSNKKLNTIPVIDDDEITSHNSQGYSYTLGSNEFFQNWMLSDAKFILNNHLTFKSSIPRCNSAEDQSIVPERFNFREQFQICAHPVYYQGNCSSSYSIAAVTAISDRLCQSQEGQFLDQLSPQSPLSCDKQKNFGCGGGSVSRVFDYAKKSGLVTRTCLEFNGKDESTDCETMFENCEQFKISDYCVASNEEQIKREIYKKGPVVAVIPIYKDFLVYKNGVYQAIEGTSKFQQGHAIKVIGWDKTESGQNYWIIENSWGDTWGQNGFGFIATGQSQLLLEEYVLAPIVEVEKPEEATEKPIEEAPSSTEEPAGEKQEV